MHIYRSYFNLTKVTNASFENEQKYVIFNL